MFLLRFHLIRKITKTQIVSSSLETWMDIIFPADNNSLNSRNQIKILLLSLNLMLILTSTTLLITTKLNPDLPCQVHVSCKRTKSAPANKKFLWTQSLCRINSLFNLSTYWRQETLRCLLMIWVLPNKSIYQLHNLYLLKLQLLCHRNLKHWIKLQR